MLIDHGDEVILPVPYWVSYKDIIQYAGGIPVFVQTEESENFRVTAAMIEAAITPRTKAIILCSPSNPSGAVMSPADLEAVVRLGHSLGIYVMLDECYVYLNFTGKIVSGASFTECKEHVLVLGSLSKTYAMTGWRAGFALGPRPIIAAIAKLQSQSTSNAASMVQRASIAAVGGSQLCVTEMRADYVQLRDQILAGFKTIPGLTCTVPEGAFYVYPNVKAFFGKGGLASPAAVSAQLRWAAPGVVVACGAVWTTEHIRLSYAVSSEVIESGVSRLRTYFASLS